jgi:hypothetical protein
MNAGARGKAWRTAIDIGLNVVLPVLIYNHVHTMWGETGGLLASSLPPLLWSVGEFCIMRRVDALSMIVLAGIVLSLLALAGGGSARFLQLREKMVTVLIAFAFLGSAMIGRPLIYPLAVATLRRTSPDSAAAFEARRDHPGVRRAMMLMTLVWGFGLLGDALVGMALTFLLSVPHYLMVAPVIGYGTMIGLALWTAWYRRRKEAEAPAIEQAAAPPNPADTAMTARGEKYI